MLQVSFVFDRLVKFTLPRWRNGERFHSIDKCLLNPLYVYFVLCQIIFNTYFSLDESFNVSACFIGQLAKGS